MDEIQREKGPLTPAEKLGVLVEFGLELDQALAMNGYAKANVYADRLTSEPKNSALVGVMATARAYLSPLTGEYEHYWPAFIAVAKHSVKQHGSDHQRIEQELYDFVGGMLMRIDEAAHPDFPSPEQISEA